LTAGPPFSHANLQNVGRGASTLFWVKISMDVYGRTRIDPRPLFGQILTKDSFGLAMVSVLMKGDEFEIGISPFGRRGGNILL
jgi:hypothetical protein